MDVFNDLNSPASNALTFGYFGSTSNGAYGEGQSAYVISNGTAPMNVGCSNGGNIFLTTSNVGIENFGTFDFAVEG